MTSSRNKQNVRRGPARTPAAHSADRRFMKQVLRLLVATHGRRQWPGPDDPVDMLVWTILSQNTSDVNSSAGFKRLQGRFANWNAAADARTGEIERCIRVCGLSRIKAPRIRQILRRIRSERGRIDLGHLAEMDPDEACQSLLALNGVGPKTALCVLLFALGVPVFPVDTHIYRITRRLGVLPPGVPVQRAPDVLTPLIAPADRYETHVLLIAHGRAVCRARKARCDECRLRTICAFGKARP